MNIALFDEYVPGLVRDQEIVDLSDVLPKAIMDAPPAYSMSLLIERFADVRADLERALACPGRPLSGVRLRAPSPMPSHMLFAIGNYHEGPVGTSKPLGLCLKAPSSILDPGGTVVLPQNDAKIFHHEAELAVVISKHCRSISTAEALDYVFGYTGVIDVSARGQDGETATLEVEGVGKLTVSVSDRLKRRGPVQIDPNIGVAIRE
jgi:Fumarylacetoacetate (FAA) hydrolase family